MNIKIHRGLDQIGGCITEISTDTSRVFIDFGQNLPGCGEPTTPEDDEQMVQAIFLRTRSNMKLYSIHMVTRIMWGCLSIFQTKFLNI